MERRLMNLHKFSVLSHNFIFIALQSIFITSYYLLRSSIIILSNKKKLQISLDNFWFFLPTSHLEKPGEKLQGPSIANTQYCPPDTDSMKRKAVQAFRVGNDKNVSFGGIPGPLTTVKSEGLEGALHKNEQTIISLLVGGGCPQMIEMFHPVPKLGYFG